MASSAVASPSSLSPSKPVLSSSQAPSPSSQAVPQPPLSYAERARKAQNIHSPIAVSHPPSDTPPSPAAHPIGNVWSKRMAAVRTTVPSTQSLPVSAPSSGPSAALPTPESADYDPFIVRTNINPIRQPPPAIDDKTWPEVGKPLQDDISINPDPVAPSPSSRKSEKTKSKWVPIPRQELQAAADALDSRRRKSSRHQSHSGSRKRPCKRPSASGSGSHSRIPSASQSRSESLQSSPLLPRGRRLPDDKEAPQTYNTQPSPRTRSPPRFNTTSHQQYVLSRPQSPPLVVQPHLAPPPQPIPVYTHPNPNPFIVRYGPGASPLPYSTSPPPAPYPPVFPYPLPLQQHVWYSGAMQRWNPNVNTSQPGSGQHSPRYPNQIPRQHHERINSPITTMIEHNKRDSICTERQNTGETGPLPPEVSLPVTVSASTPVHMYEHGSSQQIPPTFGSIDTNCNPNPVPGHKPMDEDDPKPFPQFTIGVAPGEIVTTRSRSRAHSQTSSNSGKRSRTRTIDEKLGLTEVSENGKEKRDDKHVIDLTGGKVAGETRWAFGTVATGQGEAQGDAVSPVAPKNASGTVDADAGEESRGFPLSQPSELQKRLEQLVIKERREDENDPFEVKDYGYGLGSRGSPGDSPQTQTQMEPHRYNEGEYISPVWERERERIEYAPRHSKREASSRRGGYHSHNYHSNPNYGQGAGYEGRAYPPRRGRGNNHGNGYGRGGYTHRRNGSGSGYPHQQHLHMRSSAPLSVAPPLDPVVGAGGFYAGRPMMGTGVNGPGTNGMYYDGTGYTPIPMAQSAPLPAPVTQLSFPLDTTRWYLLGQLEYYLSAQNMAQDYFLRQRLDSKGWVSISLIASFNRIRRLTEDEALVHEVLTISNVVEVQGAWVRMKDWRAFVLPGARPSSVEHDDDATTLDINHPSTWNGDQARVTYAGEDEHKTEKRQQEQDDASADFDGDVDEDDEDEDDVVFVLTRDEDSKIP